MSRTYTFSQFFLKSKACADLGGWLCMDDLIKSRMIILLECVTPNHSKSIIFVFNTDTYLCIFWGLWLIMNKNVVFVMINFCVIYIVFCIIKYITMYLTNPIQIWCTNFQSNSKSIFINLDKIFKVKLRPSFCVYVIFKCLVDLSCLPRHWNRLKKLICCYHNRGFVALV